MKKKLTLVLMALSLFCAVQAEEKEVICGQKVTVTATANSGYRFKEWSDGVTTNPRVFENVTEAKTLTAIFEAEYAWTFAAGEGGSVDKTTVTLAEGETVTVTATPDDECWEFSHWSDDQSLTNPVRTFTANSNLPTGTTITAVFKQKKFKFNISPNDASMGTISFEFAQN